MLSTTVCVHSVNNDILLFCIQLFAFSVDYCLLVLSTIVCLFCQPLFACSVNQCFAHTADRCYFIVSAVVQVVVSTIVLDYSAIQCFVTSLSTIVFFRRPLFFVSYSGNHCLIFVQVRAGEAVEEGFGYAS